MQGILFLALAYLYNGVLCAVSKEEAMRIKMNFGKSNFDVIRSNQNLSSILGQPQECSEGAVLLDDDIFECENVNFLSFIGRDDMRVERENFEDALFEMSDIWGYRSPSEREITLACQTNSIVFIDSTDPVNPKILGFMESPRVESRTCDVKVHRDTAYIVQDKDNDNDANADEGIQVFDLRRLEALDVLSSETPIKFEPDFTYSEHGSARNVIIDNDSGFLFTVGVDGGEDCDGGLHMTDLSFPLEPVFAGCASQDGFVNDAQCVVYKGPDLKYQGKEICFGFNVNTITIYDVTDKSNPEIISQIAYDQATLTNQGWLNPQQTHLLMNDEQDEATGAVPNTRTYVVNVRNLEEPIFTGEFNHSTVAIDHNLYFFGDMHRRGYGGNGPIEDHPALNFAYCSNYAAGIRILDTTFVTSEPPVLREAGFFDVSLEEGNELFGAWSSYLHPSGVLAVNSIERGVFFLNFTSTFQEPPSQPSPPLQGGSTVAGLPGGFAVLYVFIALCAVGTVFFNVKNLTTEVVPPATTVAPSEYEDNKRNAKSKEAQQSQSNPMYGNSDV